MKVSIYSRLFELLRRYNLQGRFSAEVYGTTLSPLEAYVVIEVAACPALSINAVVDILGVNRSAVSRAVGRLCRNKYLSAQVVPENRRSKTLSLLSRGELFLKIHDDCNSQFIAFLSRGLTQSEIAELAHFLDLLAENDGAKQVILRPNESVLLRGVRRLARSWDILTGSFLQSGFSVLHWQLLTEIQRIPTGVRPISLMNLFNFSKSTLSQILSRFRDEGLLRHEKIKKDLRGYVLKLTAKGERALRVINSRGALRIRRALVDLSDQERERFLNLMERYIIKEQDDPADVTKTTFKYDIRA